MQQQPMEWVACLLVDPVDGGRLPADELLGLEPERDLLLRESQVDRVNAADPDTYLQITVSSGLWAQAGQASGESK